MFEGARTKKRGISDLFANFIAGISDRWYMNAKLTTAAVAFGVFVFVIILGGLMLAVGEPSAQGDFVIYQDAATHVFRSEPLYWVDQEWPNQNPYYYTSLFAFLFGAVFNPIADASPALGFIIWYAILIASIPASIWVWIRAVKDYVHGTSFALVFLPLTFLSSDLLANTVYGNVVPLLFLATGTGFLAYSQQRPVLMGISLFFVLICKPQLALPLLTLIAFGFMEERLRWWAWVSTLITFALVLITSLLMSVVTSPDYLVDSFTDQVKFISQTSSSYPYETSFWTTNGGWQQQIFRITGESDSLLALIIPAVIFGSWLLTGSQLAFSKPWLEGRHDLILLFALGGYLVGQGFVVALMDIALVVAIWSYTKTYAEKYPFLSSRLLNILMLTIICWVPFLPMAVLAYQQIGILVCLGLIFYIVNNERKSNVQN